MTSLILIGSFCYCIWMGHSNKQNYDFFFLLYRKMCADNYAYSKF